MESFGLLMGHLLGDFIFQNDWVARWKSAKPGEMTDAELASMNSSETNALSVNTVPGVRGFRQNVESMKFDFEWRPFVACFYHCILYTFSVYLCCFWFLSWWAYPIVFIAHFPVDRWRLARKFMSWNKLEVFATGIFSPWSIIVVDNIIHLFVLYVVGILSRRYNG